MIYDLYAVWASEATTVPVYEIDGVPEYAHVQTAYNPACGHVYTVPPIPPFNWVKTKFGLNPKYCQSIQLSVPSVDLSWI